MTKSSERPYWVTRMALENWRNFTRVDTTLQQRAFLVGPNAAGKSNFLDVFRFLHDIAAIGGGFQEAVQSRGGVSRLRSLAARRYPDIAITVQVGGKDRSDVWTYDLSFSQDNRKRPIIKQERVIHRGQVVVERPNEQDQLDQAGLTQTYLEQVNANRDFRELSDFFASIRYLHIVPQLVREPARSVGRYNDPYGGDFLEQVAKTHDSTRKSRLRRILSALRVAVPQLEDLEFWRDPDRGTPHLRGKYVHWRPQSEWLTEEQFSDGTLRLVGLLWAVLDGSGPLLLEEPELSLHPDVVQFIPQMFAHVQSSTGRQVILSTHSNDLLRDTGIGLDEVLLLRPGAEGTIVEPAAQRTEIGILLNGGVPLAEAVLPYTRPSHVEQLAFFE